MEHKDFKKALDLRDKYGDDYLQKMLGVMKGNVIPSSAPEITDTSNAQLTPSTFNEPLNPDQLQSSDGSFLDRPTPNTGIPFELQKQDPSAIPKYIAVPADSTNQQISDILTPKTPQLDKPLPKAIEEAKTSMPSVDQGEKADESEPKVNRGDIAPKTEQPTSIPLQVPAQQIPIDNFDQQLQDARQQDAQHQLLFGMLKAAQMGGSSLAGGKADTSFADSELSKANEMTNQLKTNMDVKEEHANIVEKQQKRDPNSKTSKLYQDMLRQLKPDMDVSGLSAEQVEKVFPQIGAIVNKQEAIQARQDVARENALNRKSALDVAKMSKTDEQNTKRLDKLNKDMTEEVASGRSAFGQAAKNLQAIGNVKALLQGADLNSIDNRQISETARVLDKVLSGGTPTISGTAHLTPETARMKIAEYMEKFTNKVQGAGAGDFMNKFQHTFDREENSAKKQVQATQGKLLAGVSDIAKTNPDRLSAILEGHGLKGSFNQKGVFIPEGMDQESPKSTTISKPGVSSDMVKIMGPDGRTHLIPKENVDKAIARGAKVVQ